MKVFAIATLALTAHQVNAHGYLSQPAADFPNGVNTKYNAILTESCDSAFSGLKWDDSPEANTATFTTAFAKSLYATLRAMMDVAAPDCGNTVLTGSPVDVSSISSMKWQNDQEQMGFIDSHHGPCEAWIDDNKVFHSDDCRADYTGYPAEIPIDFSKCTGDCTFTFYWLALHEPNWQVYKQCAPISNGSGGGQTTTTTAPTTTQAPTATEATVTEAPASEYSPSVTTATPEATTTAPMATTATPAATTAAPTTESPASTSATSCKRRRRRMTANLRSEN